MWLLDRLVRAEFGDCGSRPRHRLPVRRSAVVLLPGRLHRVAVPVPVARLFLVRPRGPLAARGPHGVARHAHAQHGGAAARADAGLLLRAARLEPASAPTTRSINLLHDPRRPAGVDDLPEPRLRQAALVRRGAGAVAARFGGAQLLRGARRPRRGAGRAPAPVTPVPRPVLGGAEADVRIQRRDGQPDQPGVPRPRRGCCCTTAPGGCPRPTRCTPSPHWPIRCSSPQNTCRS